MTSVFLMPPLCRFFGDLTKVKGPDHFPWRHWKWCDVDDLLTLINNQFGLGWSRRHLIRRFVIQGVWLNQKPPLSYLRYDREGVLTWVRYQHDWSHYLFMNDPAHKVYLPGGWAEDVLWALQVGCRRFRILKGSLVACEEDRSPVYYV